MLQKFELSHTKRINGNVIVIKINVINIKTEKMEYWNYMTSVHAFSSAGEEISVKCFA